MKPMSCVATAILGIIAAAQLLRLLFRLPVTVAGYAVPLWMSGAAFLGLGTVAVLLYREQTRP